MIQTSSAIVRHANDRRKLFEPRTIHSSGQGWLQGGRGNPPNVAD